MRAHPGMLRLETDVDYKEVRNVGPSEGMPGPENDVDLEADQNDSPSKGMLVYTEC